MQSKDFMVCVRLTIDLEEGETMPTDEQIASAIAYSTAAEALREAFGCNVSMWVVDAAEVEGGK